MPATPRTPIKANQNVPLGKARNPSAPVNTTQAPMPTAIQVSMRAGPSRSIHHPAGSMHSVYTTRKQV